MLASQSEELEFTEDEDRRFKLENVMLQRHFQHNLEDAKYDSGSVFEECVDVSFTVAVMMATCRKMESKMAAISNLMAQFADKIMEQQTDIELIHQHAQETNTNVAQVRGSCNTALNAELSLTNSLRMLAMSLDLCTRQSNRILEQTEKIGRGYGFMIFCIYVGFSVLLHLLHYFHD